LRNIVEIKKVDASQIRDLRYKVLWPHLEGPDACQIAPDSADSTFHMAAIADGKVVGTATLIVDINPRFTEKNQYRLRAMATDPEMRGYGVGAQLVMKAIEELKKKNVKLLWCDARLIATGFYEKQDFKIKGRVYQVPKIGPHKLMYKAL
tara:strand:+ start:1235 stop:1684 length:450 start_codon:yes stop_codon:yes gene_type:complete